MDNEQVVRKLYELAEVKDYPGFVACFTEDGTFTDMSVGVTYRGPKELPTPGVNMAAAFPDMHRELYTIPATGKRMDAPCCDVFQLVDGKIQRFDCYPSGTVILSQLGVLTNLEAVVAH